MNRSWLWLLSALLLAGCGPLRVQRYLRCFEGELLLAHPEAQVGTDRSLLLELVLPAHRDAVDRRMMYYRSYRLEVEGKPFVLHLFQAVDGYDAGYVGRTVQNQLVLPVSTAGIEAYYKEKEPAVYGLLASVSQGNWLDAQQALRHVMTENVSDCN